MKKLLLSALLLCFAAISYGQIVSGRVFRTNGDTVKSVLVYMYPDTLSGPKTFQPMFKLSDSTGLFVFQFGSPLPGGSVFKVSTLDCDSANHKINTHIYTGNNITSNLIVCVKPATDFGGYVHLGNASNRPQPQEAFVYMISECGTTLTYIDTVETDTNGYFKIDSIPALATGCEMIMKAALKTSSPKYKKYLPAYHESNTNYSLRWSDARDIPYSIAKGGINILLPEAINPHGGPSIIAGYAMDVTTGNKLEGKVLFLTDMNDVTVDYTYTNSSGNFSFTNIPFGTYKVFGDVWGKDNPDLVVKVDADHVHILNIIFRDHPTKFEGSIATSIAGTDGVLHELSLYPNPARDYVSIKGVEHIHGTKQVQLTNITGAVVYTTTVNDGTEVVIPLTEYAAGMYMLQLRTESGNANFKLVK